MTFAPVGTQHRPRCRSTNSHRHIGNIRPQQLPEITWPIHTNTIHPSHRISISPTNTMATNVITATEPEPSMAYVIALLKQCASKDDMNDLKSHLNTHKRETDEEIDELKQQVDYATTTSNTNAEKIVELQASIETLKQEKLQNNICVSGVPVSRITKDNTADIIIAIEGKLDVSLAKKPILIVCDKRKKIHYCAFSQLQTQATTTITHSHEDKFDGGRDSQCKIKLPSVFKCPSFTVFQPSFPTCTQCQKRWQTCDGDVVCRKNPCAHTHK